MNGNPALKLIKGDTPATMTIDQLFPNPASDSLNVMIATPNQERVTMIIADIAGKKIGEEVVTVEAGSNTVTLNISKLVSGTYVLKLVGDNKYDSVVGKFMKQ